MSSPRVSLLVAVVLAGCATTPPKAEQTAEVAIAPVAPLTSSRRGDDRPPPARLPVAASAGRALDDEDRDRDPRIRSLPRTLLESEADQLSQLLAQTQRNAPDYGMVMLRVGHAYGAVEGAAWHEGDVEGVARARDAALGTYARFLTELPKHASVPEALYFAGLEEERRGNIMQARKNWFTVVSEHPTHKLVAACYYGFGVLFRVDAEKDPSKRTYVRQAFEEVVKRPPGPLARRAQAYLSDGVAEPAP